MSAHDVQNVRLHALETGKLAAAIRTARTVLDAAAMLADQTAIAKTLELRTIAQRERARGAERKLLEKLVGLHAGRRRSLLDAYVERASREGGGPAGVASAVVELVSLRGATSASKVEA